MPALDSSLEPGLSVLDKRRLFSDRAVWTYALVGLAVVLTFWSGLWATSGYLKDSLAAGRIHAALVTALYGIGLGWVMFPRFGGLFRDD